MISVVIVNYNGRAYLHRCLRSLADQTTADHEVIVVDNASSDGSVDLLEEDFPGTTLIRAGSNLGFAAGANAGIRASSGDYIMTLNNDTSIHPECLEHLSEAMKSRDDVGMCATKMLFFDGTINSTGICISRSGAAWDRGMHDTDTGEYDRLEEVFGPCGGAALYRRSMLDEIGLFDEDFFLYMEDVDLAFRGRLSGWKCLYVPHARVYHIHGGTAGVGSDLAIYYGNRNILWYVLKNFPGPLLLTSLPWIISRNIGILPYYAIQGKGRTILRSKWDALRGIPMMLRKRGSIRQIVPDHAISIFIHTLYRERRLHVAPPL